MAEPRRLAPRPAGAGAPATRLVSPLRTLGALYVDVLRNFSPQELRDLVASMR